MSTRFKFTKALMCLFAIFMCVTAFSLEVDEIEIKKTAQNEITFINYEGPHQLVNTLDEIKGIGTSLKSAVQDGSAGSRGAYYIIHAEDSSIKEGFDADILFLGKYAGVDHVRNLRVIIASYLSSAYNYSYQDAYTVATFVTIYNAVYRGNIDYFTKNYKPVVIQHVTKDNVGLSTRWDEWAGQTAIIIPLSMNTSVSAVDTTVISDDKVIESIKETEDKKGIEERKELTDLKEREAEKAAEVAEEKKEEAKKAQDDAKKATEQLVQLQVELEDKKKEDKKLEEKPNKTPQEEKKVEENKKETEKKEAEIKEKQEEVKEKEEIAKEKAEEAQKAEDFAIKKEEEARSDRESIAQDQVDLMNEEDSKDNALQNTVAGLRVVDEVALLSEIVMIDTTNGKTIKTSTLNAIHGREIVSTGSAYIAIAGSEKTGSSIRLVQIDPVTLDIIKQGTDEIANNSVLVQNGPDLYAVVKTATGNYLARFNQDLQLQAQSDVVVSPITPITIDRSTVVVQQETGAMILLQTASLKAITK